MPVHDWTRVDAGIFHAFHEGWIIHLSERLNDGVLPPDYYSLPEQAAGGIGPDVLTLQAPQGNGAPGGGVAGPLEGAVAVSVSPPRVRFTALTTAEIDDPVLRQRSTVIRHRSNDQIIALIEVVSPGNKASEDDLRSFVDKAVMALLRGIHLLVIDLFPPTPRDPNGIHAAIWARFGQPGPPTDPEQPLTLASYAAGEARRAYVETSAVGRELVDMPLFLTPEWYVNVPLEETYQRAWRGVPRRWRRVLEGQEGT